MNKFLDFCVEYLPEMVYRFVFGLLPAKYFIRWKAHCFSRPTKKRETLVDLVKRTNKNKN